MKELGALRFLDRILADGWARFVGFSFHDEVGIFKEIVDAYDWAVCQIQYNYLDRNYQAAERAWNTPLQEHGPGHYGAVAGRQTGRAGTRKDTNHLDSAPVKRSPSEWALRWVWNHPEVSTALSGMNSMAQLQENLRIADEGQANSLPRRPGVD